MKNSKKQFYIDFTLKEDWKVKFTHDPVVIKSYDDEKGFCVVNEKTGEEEYYNYKQFFDHHIERYKECFFSHLPKNEEEEEIMKQASWLTLVKGLTFYIKHKPNPKNKSDTNGLSMYVSERTSDVFHAIKFNHQLPWMAEYENNSLYY